MVLLTDKNDASNGSERTQYRTERDDRYEMNPDSFEHDGIREQVQIIQDSGQRRTHVFDLVMELSPSFTVDRPKSHHEAFRAKVQKVHRKRCPHMRLQVSTFALSNFTAILVATRQVLCRTLSL